MRKRRSSGYSPGRRGALFPAGILAWLCAAVALTLPAEAYLIPHLRLALAGGAWGGPWSDCQVRHPALLRELYADRRYAPLWVGDGGIAPRFELGLAVLEGASRHGLHTDRYHLGRLKELAAQLGPHTRPAEMAHADLLLSDGLLEYALHLSRGGAEPSRLHPAWVPEAAPVDVLTPVLGLAKQGAGSAFERALAPSRDLYWRTLRAAESLEAVIASGGWPRLDFDATLRRGDRRPEVSALRRRLRASDKGVPREATAPVEFDEPLEQAVRRFQRRHGLDVDGVVGPRTLEELQVPAEQRRQQLLLTLERLRWLPRRWSGRTLVVNAADYALEAYQGEELVLEMRTIVGTSWQKTPVLRERLERVELNPYWKVPLSIAVQELLPKIREDCGYLERNGFELVSSYSDSAAVLDATAVDWETVGWRNFPGRIRQCPGPENALGRLKFLFPNHLDVYLHDTPQRTLFSRARRSLSHGCVRVEQPITLAHYVLQDHPEWPAERIDAVIASGERHVVGLRTPSEVYLLYWTAWADAAGRLQFRPDVYDRDAELQRALSEADTSSRTAALESASDGGIQNAAN